MGIGEAAVTTLSDEGVPTPVVHTRLRAPASRMGPADDVDGTAKASPLFAKYGTRVDSESAREMLAGRMEKAEEKPAKPKIGHQVSVDSFSRAGSPARRSARSRCRVTGTPAPAARAGPAGAPSPRRRPHARAAATG